MKQIFGNKIYQPIIQINGIAKLLFKTRKHPAKGLYKTGNDPIIIFVTVCTEDRIPWLCCDDVHEILTSIWQEASTWLVGDYMIMPDHIHLFASCINPEISLDNWVKYWKSQFAKKHNNPTHKWQIGQWDTRLRSNEKYQQKWEYVKYNPMRKGLVNDSDEWRYQGRLNDLY